MTNILQLRQEQLPELPFTFYRGLVVPGTTESLVTDHEDRYLMVPTQMIIADEQGQDNTVFNVFLGMARVAGFTHLMLIYV